MTDARDRQERNARRTRGRRRSLAGAGAALSLLVAGVAGAQDALPPSAAPPPADAPVAAAPPPTADTGTTSATEPRGEKNPANYEFGFVSAAAYQTWAICGRWLYLGAGGGLGPLLYRVSKMADRKMGWDPNLDIVYAQGFVRVAPVKYVDLDLGPKIAITSALFDVKDAPQSGFSMGGYVDLRVGSETVKVGPRFEFDRIAYSDFYESGWKLTPLLVRVMH